jgi:hypothetical protein
MLRASEIVALRALGLSVAQVARVLEGNPQNLESALAAHEASLERKIREFVVSIDKIRGIRADLARGQVPINGELARLPRLLKYFIPIDVHTSPFPPRNHLPFAGQSLGSSMLTPHFGHATGRPSKIATDLNSRLARQRGHTNP